MIYSFLGKEIEHCIDTVANIRLAEFREFPYLYAGNIKEERDYLIHFAKNEQSLFLLAKHNNEIMGLFTGAPLVALSEHMPQAIQVLAANGYVPSDCYYVGELIVIPKFRRQGIARQLFEKQEAYARSLKYKTIFGLTIERGDDHPLKPTHYRDNDEALQKLGLVRTQVQLKVSWPTLLKHGGIANLENSLNYWTKTLD